MEDAILGSTAERVARRADVPVLVIPAEYDQPWDADPQVRVMVALDGSAEAEVALNPGRAFCEAFRGTISLVCCVEDGARSQPEQLAEAVEHARTYLNQLATTLRANGLAQVDLVVETGAPGDLLPRLAIERDADLVVMASHGRGGFQRLALGSVAEATLRAARVPVLVSRRPPP
jgi:nucleotide-binding universal stress UspA family protein